MAALDVGVDVVGDGPLDSLRWNSSLESGTWAITRTGSSQLVQNVLVYVVVIPVHHGHHFVEIAEDGV